MAITFNFLNLYNINWKKKKTRKPLLLDGARQAGKTYLVESIFGPQSFAQIHKFDFHEDKGLHQYFKGNLHPDQIIKNLQLHQARDINPERDLIFSSRKSMRRLVR